MLYICRHVIYICTCYIYIHVIYILLMGVAPNPESSKVTPVTTSSKLLPRKLLLTTLIPQRYPVGLDHQAAMPYGSKEAMPSLPCTLQRAP